MRTVQTFEGKRILYSTSLDLPMNRKILTKDELLYILKGMIFSIERRDSSAGHLEYEWSKKPDEYLVAAAVRTGNSEGQGGTVVVGKFDSINHLDQDGPLTPMEAAETPSSRILHEADQLRLRLQTICEFIDDPGTLLNSNPTEVLIDVAERIATLRAIAESIR